MSSPDTVINALDDFCKILTRLQDKGVDFSKFAKEIAITLNETDRLKLMVALLSQKYANIDFGSITITTDSGSKINFGTSWFLDEISKKLN